MTTTITKYFFTFCILTICNAALFQTTIAIHSFEQNSTDTWTPVLFSAPPCTNGGDQWDYATNLVTLSPNHLNQFWGIKDLNGNCGSGTGETISFPNISTALYSNISISFDYNVFEFDSGDDLFYTLTLNGTTLNEIKFFDGYLFQLKHKWLD